MQDQEQEQNEQMSLKLGKTIRTLSLSQNYLVLIKKSVLRNEIFPPQGNQHWLIFVLSYM